MNLNNFKEKLIKFIMKKWTCPVICGICILLIFAMSVNSFAKYYTRVQEERLASVAVYCSSVQNDEQFWDKGYLTQSGIVGYAVDSKIEKSNMTNGCVRIYMGSDYSTAKGYLPYVSGTNQLANRSCQISVTNNANGKICEVALRYTIIIEFPLYMPKGILWDLTDTSGAYIPDLTATSYTSSSYYKTGYEFSAPSFTLSPGAEEIDTYLILFSESNDFSAVESNDRFFDDIRVSIKTTQITQ